MNPTTKQLDDTYVAHTYARFPVELTRGSGSVLTDPDGREYIDLGTGIGVNAFGLADPEWVRAVTEQAARLPHTSNLYYTEPCARLAELLCRRTGMRRVFFGNSGAEANECAIKAARKYSAAVKGADHFTIVTLWNSFHGRTLTTLSATGQEHYHELYQPLTPGFVHVHAEDIDELRRVAREAKAAGVLLECVQGEGGVVVLSREYVRAVAAFCAEENIPLMVDEVQTGNGRTGALYAYMNYGITPDIVSTAKGLGGGLPLGACLLGEKLADVFAPGDHGSTFGGNPICCAGALSILSRIDDALLASVREKGEYLLRAFAGAPGVQDVRGLGLMVGILPVRPAGEVVSDCLSNGVLCLTAKDRIRLLPALTIPMDKLEQAVSVLLAALRA